MDAGIDAMLAAAGFGAFCSLVLGVVVALRRLAEPRSASPRARARARRAATSPGSAR